MYQQITLTKRSLVMTFIMVSILVYFAFHAMYGDRGFFAYIKAAKEIKIKKQELSHLQAARLDTEHKVGLLRSDSLDLDFVEEQVRTNLGFIAPGEKIIVDSSVPKS